MEHYEIQVVGHLDQRRAHTLGCESLRLLPGGRPCSHSRLSTSRRCTASSDDFGTWASSSSPPGASRSRCRRSDGASPMPTEDVRIARQGDRK